MKSKEKVRLKLDRVKGFVQPLHNYTQTPPGLLRKDTTESIMQYKQHALAFSDLIPASPRLCVLIRAEQLAAGHGVI